MRDLNKAMNEILELSRANDALLDRMEDDDESIPFYDGKSQAYWEVISIFKRIAQGDL